MDVGTIDGPIASYLTEIVSPIVDLLATVELNLVLLLSLCGLIYDPYVLAPLFEALRDQDLAWRFLPKA